MRNPLKITYLPSQAGQSIIEYLLLMVACILVFLTFLSPVGLFRSQLQKTVNQIVDQQEDMADHVVFP